MTSRAPRQAGRMTKADRRNSLIALVVVASENDRKRKAEALAELNYLGFDPRRCFK